MMTCWPCPAWYAPFTTPRRATGGILPVAGEYLEEHNSQARLTMFGQEFNVESYAICKVDMLIDGQDTGKWESGQIKYWFSNIRQLDLKRLVP